MEPLLMDIANFEYAASPWGQLMTHGMRDVRQIGPGSERHISGICKQCGATLFARLDEKAVPTEADLKASLDLVFKRHVLTEHREENARQDDDEAQEADTA